MFEWKQGLTIEERISKNTSNIVQTKKNEVRFDVEFGINPNYVDKGINQSVSIAVTEILDAVTQYEPRASLNPNSVLMNISGNSEISLEVSKK